MTTPQTITFDALAPIPYSQHGTIALTASASSGLPVTYTSSDPSVVEVSGSTLIIRAVGSANITASQSGDNTYEAAASVEQTQQITIANQTITFAALAPQTYSPNGTITLTASASSGLPVTYASSDPSVVEVSGSTLIIRAVGSGSAIITASQLGDNNYNAAASVQQTQQITKANQTITFAALAPQTYSPNGTITLTATASSGLPVSYASNLETVVKVSGNNLIMKATGSATITATQSGDNNYNAATLVERTQQIILITSIVFKFIQN